MSISIDVDIDDIIYGMGKWDRKKFFQEMQRDGYISKLCIVTDEGEVKAPNRMEQAFKYESTNEFNRALQKLYGNGWRLTLEQEQYIIELSKRL